MKWMLPIVIILCVRSTFAQAESVSIQKIAIAGEPAPGGGVFRDFIAGLDWVVANNRGSVAFSAHLDDGGESPFPDGIFLWRNSQIHKVIRTGDILPGGDVVLGTSSVRIALNDKDEIAARVAVRTPEDEVEHLLVRASMNEVQEVLRTGTGAPSDGATVVAFSKLSMNDNGAIAFAASVKPEGATSSLIAFMAAFPDGELFELARAANTSWSDCEGEGFRYIADRPRINHNDTIAFAGEYCDGTRAILRWARETGLECVMADGDPSPVNGQPMQVLFVAGSSWTSSMIDDSDRVLASGRPPDGQYFATHEEIERVWVIGDSVDADQPSGVYTDEKGLNNRGQVVMVAYYDVNGNFEPALFKAGNGHAELIARAGVTLDDWPTPFAHALYFHQNINDAGQVAFAATVEPSFTRGIFLTDCSDQVHTVAVSGFPITIEGGTYTAMIPSNQSPIGLDDAGPSGGRRGLNDRGEFAFVLALEDSPGTFKESVLLARIPGCPCTGDSNLDHTVNVFDLLNVLSQWGPCDGFCEGDLNFDHVVNVTDLLAVLAGWGPCPFSD